MRRYTMLQLQYFGQKQITRQRGTIVPYKCERFPDFDGDYNGYVPSGMRPPLGLILTLVTMTLLGLQSISAICAGHAAARPVPNPLLPGWV
jgi:hypothetical protein